MNLFKRRNPLVKISRFESELRGFREWRVKSGALLSPGAVAFMMELFFLFDAHQWPDVTEVAIEIIGDRLGITKKTALKYRDELIDLEIIKIDPSAGGKPSACRLRNFSKPEELPLENPKISPGLTAVICAAEILGVYINDYSERKIARLVRQFDGRKVVTGLLDYFNRKGRVDIDDFSTKAFFSGGFGKEVSKRAISEQSTNYSAGSIGESESNSGEVSSDG